ncbi:hypothetical protein [Nonomuraea guangzhouensis]|uniref:DMT family transporter n=1 Tax=Nonomuraea guangzhouensis TaxID=1291555 RepID=A0ABW4GKC3_9ACTN|nr:hypothetical protein [Nonomuraea guangzhouensis]
MSGLVVASWGLLTIWRARSFLAVFRQPDLLTAAAGGIVTLGAAPADAFWHDAFGRDAVLWSPPHILGVFGTVALIVGIVAGVRPGIPSWLTSAAGALLLGGALVSVMEFETDVPQFNEALYLPVLLIGAMFATLALRQLMPGRFSVARVVCAYGVARLIITAVLLVLGRTTPDLPLAIIGLAAMDLPWRRATTAYAAGAAGISLTTLISSSFGLTSVPVLSVLPTALPVTVVFVVAALAESRRLRPAATALLLGGIIVLPLTDQDQALAHDPGQGEPVAQVSLVGTSDGHGSLSLTGELPRDATPSRIVARRAGETVTGTLGTGTVRVPPTGVWFVYLEATHPRGAVETWLPLDASAKERVSERRDLYLPVGRASGASMSAAQIATGAALYALGIGVLVLAVAQARRASVDTAV